MAKVKDTPVVEDKQEELPNFAGFEPPPTPGETFGGDEMFEADLSDPGVTGVLPEGVIPAYLVDVIKDVSQKGDDMWVWYFQPLVDFSVNTLRLYTVLTANAFWKATETLTALGLGEIGKKTKFSKDDALYRLCQLQIVHEEYPKGSKQIRAGIGRVLPHPDGIGKKFKPFTGVPDMPPSDDSSDTPSF